MHCVWIKQQERPTKNRWTAQLTLFFEPSLKCDGNQVFISSACTCDDTEQQLFFFCSFQNSPQIFWWIIVTHSYLICGCLIIRWVKTPPTVFTVLQSFCMLNKNYDSGTWTKRSNRQALYPILVSRRRGRCHVCAWLGLYCVWFTRNNGLFILGI